MTKMLMGMGAVVTLLLLVASIFAGAIGLGMVIWRWIRSPLYTRELTPQEQWAERSTEAEMDEEEWSALLASSTEVESKRVMDDSEDDEV